MAASVEHRTKAQVATATRRTGIRAVSIVSVSSDASLLSTSTPRSTRLPPQYLLPPTIPLPFEGTLEASLDAVLAFVDAHPVTHVLKVPLLERPKASTDWPRLVSEVLQKVDPRSGRRILEELLFLVTRTLLPNQIVENRSLVLRMHEAKRNLSSRVLLRYDLLRERVKRDQSHALTVESRPPPGTRDSTPCSKTALVPPPPVVNPRFPSRRPLLPNVIPTLIVAPEEGYGYKRTGDAMRHHVTELDRYLLLSDEEVEGWGGTRLVLMLGSVVLAWQWIRESTQTLEEMEAGGWEELEEKAEVNDWVGDLR